jgi:hypothetical protein
MQPLYINAKNTMNFSERSVDKEIFSKVYEEKYNIYKILNIIIIIM